MFSLLNPAAALVAGLVASLHCVGMCGPLSCSLIGAKQPGRSEAVSRGLYHFGRLASYSALGGLAGALGSQLVSWLGENPARYAPWAFALFFLVLALGWDATFTRWQASKGYGRGLVQRAYRVSGHTRGLALGLATPLIPCGPLYLILWATTMSGSAIGGAMVMAAFALGTVPLLLLGQTGWSWLAGRAQPQRLSYLRRGLALAALAALCVRGFMDVSVAGVAAGGALCN